MEALGGHGEFVERPEQIRPPVDPFHVISHEGRLLLIGGNHQIVYFYDFQDPTLCDNTCTVWDGAACHNSPHAIAPSVVSADNMKAVNLQGHVGKIDQLLGATA